jgi:hypothetical protein
MPSALPTYVLNCCRPQTVRKLLTCSPNTLMPGSHMLTLVTYLSVNRLCACRTISGEEPLPTPKEIQTPSERLLLQSLNQVIDLESARWTAFNNHVPGMVIYMNAYIALLAVSVIGYSLGLGDQRQLFSTCILTLAITMVLAVIVDLDSPRRGFIRVSQQPMIDLQRQLATRASSAR